MNTGFLTSLFPGIRIIISTTLSSDIRRAMSRSVKGGKVVNCYPDNYVTAALLERAVGGDLVIYNSECEAVRELDAMKALGKEAYGGGYLLSSSAAQRVSAAKANNDRVVKWELSPRELKIIEKLDGQNNTNDNST